jgi:hypothetical protein
MQARDTGGAKLLAIAQISFLEGLQKREKRSGSAMRKRPGEYSRLARECENLEARVEDEAIRRTYGELAAHWRKLAVEEERGDEEEQALSLTKD